MPEGPEASALDRLMVRQSPMGLLANFRARRMGFPVPFAAG
eukprot:CAMPEP_0171198626 /NCGR_PEP_ID=MMETSP0790-20130122/23040_1 /TAXON_ID=2925 /ORGANISM="Alexandrium catenella, Strain OF101" /LENGTH=40 /DNA_ID= /DNA_START= /DNA_END= /DNA_ORIENTATION=